ncbi:hydrogenase 4 subunit B [Candidatus Methylospira mobilis]|uniref:Hydrogenase 4 subunit B n=1 Tax=Candidatus Methylospira mobilis TaxID=1808979 RepID=A0A5Q0BPB5_9GAMM|nr:hydrogenase 4 subunit B [Candidatus Methylospira mobilis]QFY44121.1 hydrogenase 4 subunit B [Candidatus Methylospira mobilis]WNV06470.1 hydrogenase 4 subunit B [Candidatus Methylospira mobilis]
MALFFAYLSVLAALLSGFAAIAARSGVRLPASISAIFLFGNPVVSGSDEKLDGQINKQVARRLRSLVFILLGVSGGAALSSGLTALLAGSAAVAQLPFGLPWLHWHIRIDALSAFFLVIVGIGVIAVSLYAPGYLHESRDSGRSFGRLSVATALFIAGMELLLLADDAFFFVIAWELMSVSSYFLVAHRHERAANRRASFLYLLMAQVGASAIILSFGVLAGFGHAFTFDAMRAADLSPLWATAAFALALMGFGMKAGLVPLHVWLPESYPVAPSHLVGLMSGVMSKLAVYGLIRFSYDLLGNIHWEWGVVVLLLGTASAAMGILYAMQENQLKRLLAYSSIENIGIIFIGLGFSMIYIGSGHRGMAVLGLIAALYHTLNHSLFKHLLFLAAGSVLHQTRHQTDMEYLGGLIRRMPKTAFLFLIGCIGISALPPLNGFVSEWLTFQAALQAPAIENGILRSMIPVASAILAFSSALASACFVKAFGVTFLGQPRSRHAHHANEVTHRGMLSAPALLAALCLLFGLFPNVVIHMLGNVSALLLEQPMPEATARGWLWLTPGTQVKSSYSAPLIVGVLAAVGWISYRLSNRKNAQVRRAARWDCGFGALTPRMQYTSTAFSQPIRRIFLPFLDAKENVETSVAERNKLQVTEVRHQLDVGDHIWRAIYLPIAHSVETAAKQISHIQGGNIRTYLAYSFVTLVFLLGVVS